LGGIEALINGARRRKRPQQVAENWPTSRETDWSGLERALYTLAAERPEFSARIVATRPQMVLFLALVASFLFLVVQWPRQTFDAVVGTMAAGFVISVVTRCCLVLLRRSRAPGLRVANDMEWPVYSLLIPLYREAEILPQLAGALSTLDYPLEKLDIHLVMEEDDRETRVAADRFSYAQVLVPTAEPRTKPKACSYASEACRGEFVVVFDAEDRPESDQLKKAVQAFRAYPEISCFQARLVVDRSGNWLQHLFALDYGIWFTALLPGLERLQAPIPLGGTSNHFRRTALIDVGLWEPFNVTEDADIGIRMARLGYRIGLLDSSTFEEAPASLPIWLRQRTRWLKGYMQTLLVHSRNPITLSGQLGITGIATLWFFLGGAIWSGLVNPLLWLCFIASATAHPFTSNVLSAFAQICGLTLLVVNALLAMLGATAGQGGRQCPRLFAIVSYPFYWLLISIAAYRALWQLLRDPFVWEKTPHGTGATP